MVQIFYIAFGRIYLLQYLVVGILLLYIGKYTLSVNNRLDIIDRMITFAHIPHLPLSIDQFKLQFFIQFSIVLYGYLTVYKPNAFLLYRFTNYWG